MSPKWKRQVAQISFRFCPPDHRMIPQLYKLNSSKFRIIGYLSGVIFYESKGVSSSWVGKRIEMWLKALRHE